MKWDQNVSRAKFFLYLAYSQIEEIRV